MPILNGAKNIRMLAKFSQYQKRNASNVGFIGLGNMGSGMASNLMQKGSKVVVFDVFESATKPLVVEGAQLASSPAEVAAKCDRIVTMLPTGAHVEEVVAGPNGLLSSAKPGTLIIDCSTVEPECSVKMNQISAAKKVQFVDAPVSGGVNAAKQGTLTFMVGGDEKSAEAAKKVLEQMGKNIVHCGPVGCGGAAKICNNMMLAISMIGYSETMNLGLKLGLDAKTLNNILSVSSGNSWVSQVYSSVPGVMPNVPSSNGYQGGFASKLMLKDLNLAQGSAVRHNAPTPLGALSLQFYRLVNAKGNGDKDFGVIYEHLKDSK